MGERPTLKCCNRLFYSQAALKQHLQDSPAHAFSFNCEDCDRGFDSQHALYQHLSTSQAHVYAFECKECDREFSSQQALNQHLEDSQVHTSSFECRRCNRNFDSEHAYSQHVNNSLAHSSVCRSKYQIVKTGWGSRSIFQASYGLKVTPEDIEEGESILKPLQKLNLN